MADNSPIPPSGVVSELKEVIEESFVFPDGADFFYEHPLHPFNAAYFDPSVSLFSYSDNYCRMAGALMAMDWMAGAGSPKGFIQKQGEKKPVESLYDIGLEDMLRFFRHPIKAFFTEGLNMTLSSPEEFQEDRELFVVKGLDQYLLGSRVLEKLSEDFPGEFPATDQTTDQTTEQPKDLYPVLKAGGFLPPGKKGRAEYENLLAEAGPLLKEARQIALKAKLPVLSGEVLLNDLCIRGHLANIREDGLYFISFGRLNGARLLSAWIKHLFLNAAGPADYPKETMIIGRDPDNKKPILQFVFPKLGTDANTFLEELTRIYQKGLHEPFCFFSETSYQLAKTLSKSDFDLSRESVIKAMKQVKKYWFDSFRETGEKMDRYAALFAEGQEPFGSVEAFGESGFVDNALKIYQTLIENYELRIRNYD